MKTTSGSSKSSARQRWEMIRILTSFWYKENFER
uniref:Uncharacterized protein n=1 Tax=Brugia malayi TaxID=6279 RepID=A8QBT9_BRUMA